MKVEDLRRPEDWYDLDEVCQAAGEVSENAQGMLSYKRGLTNQGPKRGSSLVQATAGKSLALANKLESIEEHQALEKDCLDVANKQWGTKLEAIKGLIKMLLSQAQEKPSSTFVQNMGPGYRSGNNTELPGRPFGSFSSGMKLICFRCGESRHFQNRVKSLYLFTVTIGTKGVRCVLERELRNWTYLALQVIHGISGFLHQKEGWFTLTGAGLLGTEYNHGEKQVPTSPHLWTCQQTSRSQVLH